LRDPARVMARLNRSFSSLTTAGQFVCFFYGLYDLREHTLRYCNAGMNPPLLFRKDQAYLESLNKGGPVLGVNPDQHYRSGTLILRDSDLLLGFSDGVTEQTNEAGQFFDEERLVATVRARQARPLEELREAIFTAVSEFGGSSQSDDRTVVLLQIHPAAEAVATA
jgi:sigma-B regulation protein RsbU (phosphoserine phosphatase)